MSAIVASASSCGRRSAGASQAWSWGFQRAPSAVRSRRNAQVRPVMERVEDTLDWGNE